MPENKLNLDSLFEAAINIKSTEGRAAFLQKSCGDDLGLRKQLELLLQSDEQAGSFLEKPPAEVEATIIGQAAEDLAASMEAGLSKAFPEDAAIVIGRAGHSVLKSLGQSIDVPHVALREPKAEGEDPLVRPKSSEMPNRNSDSRYQLQGEIARGGMGAIIKGRDIDLGRDLAIKVLLDEHQAKPDVIQRFVEEAQIGGQLQHPGIAPVYELGQFADKRPFFSMKLVKGETLAKLLAARENPAEDRGRFLGIFKQICQTMAYAHSRGVIHRDLKPANIMVGSFGEVQVMDWGLAKVLASGGVADEKKAHDTQLGKSVIQTLRTAGSDTSGTFGTLGSQTQMGSVMGTPAYMPPEQALGEIDNLDERADVFGLGAILCEILTGKPPYVADDGTQVYRMASRGKLEDCMERLDSSDADLELIALTKHCLELEPVNRPPDAGTLTGKVTGYLESVENRLREAEIQRASESARADAETAQRIAENQRAEAESARADAEIKRRRTSLALAASVLLLVGLGGSSWLYQERQEVKRQEAEAMAQTRHAQEMETLAKEKEQLRKEAVEALRIAEIQGYDSAIAAARSDLDRNDSRSLRQRLSRLPEHLRSWEWDYLWNTADPSVSTPVQLPAVSEGYAMVITDDGTLVASRPDGSGDWPISIHDARTGELVREIQTHSSSDPQLQFSPDTRYLAYSFGGAPGFQIYDVATGSPKIPENLSHTYTDFFGFDQAGDHVVLVEGSSQRATLFQIDGWQAKGSFPEGKNSRLKYFDRRRLPLALSRDGQLLVVTTNFATSDRTWRFKLDVCSLTSNKVVKEIEISEAPIKLWFTESGTHFMLLSSRGLTPYSINSWEPESEPMFFENGNETTSLLGRYMHTSGNDTFTFDNQGEVIVLSPYDLSERTRLKGHNAPGRSLAVDQENNELVAAYADGSVRRWSLDFEQWRLSLRGKAVSSPDAVTFWNSETSSTSSPILAREMDSVSGMPGSILAACPPTTALSSSLTDMAFSPDGNRVAVSTTSTWGWGRWRVYDRWTGMPQHVEVQQEDSTCIGWSGDGRWIVVGYEVHSRPAGIVRIYDAQTFREVKRINDFAGQVKDLALSPDNRFFVAACQDGRLSSWSLPEGKLLHRSGTQGDPEKTCLVWPPQSDEVVAGSIDGSMVVWNPLTGEKRVRLALHGGPVTSVICTPDGRRVLSGSDDQTIRVLDTATWREILMLPLSAPPGSMVLSADGKQLVTSAEVFDAEHQSVRTLERKRSQAARQKMEPVVTEAYSGLPPDADQFRDRFQINAMLLEAAKQDASEIFDAERQSLRTLQSLATRQKMGPVFTKEYSAQPDVNQLRERIVTDATFSEEEKQDALLLIRNYQSYRVVRAYRFDNAIRLTARVSAREILGNQMKLKNGNRLPSDEINEIVRRSLERAKDLDPLEVQVFKEYLPAVLNALPGPEYHDDFLVLGLADEIVFDKDEQIENYLYAYFGVVKLLQESPDDKQILRSLAAAEYRVGLYSDAIESALHCNQLYDLVLPQNLAIIAMAQHRMGDSAAAKQTMEQIKATLARSRWDSGAYTLHREAGEVLGQPSEAWDEVAAWERCRQSLLDLGLDPVKVAAWERQSVARYAERHKN